MKRAIKHPITILSLCALLTLSGAVANAGAAQAAAAGGQAPPELRARRKGIVIGDAPSSLGAATHELMTLTGADNAARKR